MLSGELSPFRYFNVLGLEDIYVIQQVIIVIVYHLIRAEDLGSGDKNWLG